MKQEPVEAGSRYGSLVITREVEPSYYQGKDGRERKSRRVEAFCDCGNYTRVRLCALRAGTTSSCGCGMKHQVVEGTKFGNLTILEEVVTLKKKRRFKVRCDCGLEKVIVLASLLNGQSKTCGCGVIKATTARNTKHGHALRNKKKTEYKIWEHMVSRCHNDKNVSYPDYGGRGIFVCNLWRTSFEEFLRDVGSRPSITHSIDRVDNSKGYEPGNVRWATKKEQARNRRSCHLVTINGITQTIVEWSEMPGARAQSSIGACLKAGWTPIEAVFGRPKLQARTRV